MRYLREQTLMSGIHFNMQHPLYGYIQRVLRDLGLYFIIYESDVIPGQLIYRLISDRFVSLGDRLNLNLSRPANYTGADHLDLIYHMLKMNKVNKLRESRLVTDDDYASATTLAQLPSSTLIAENMGVDYATTKAVFICESPFCRYKSGLTTNVYLQVRNIIIYGDLFPWSKKFEICHLFTLTGSVTDVLPVSSHF